jgi:hypothetical protein
LKTLILPDSHLRFRTNDQIIKKESPDFIISLGDNFDQFYDDPEENRRAAMWLKAKLKTNNFVCLWSNHDLAYASVNKNTRCSGWTPEKDLAINEILTEHDWKKLKWFYFLDDILITHAGLNAKLVGNRKAKDIRSWLEIEAPKATEEAWKLNGKHWFFQCGRARYGDFQFGGILWNDFNVEHTPISGLKQVLGHSIVPKPTYKGSDLCIDTNSQDYVIYQDGRLEIKEVIFGP